LTAGSRSDGAGKIAVLIAEGDARVRHGLRSVIESFPNLVVLGEVASARAALDFVANSPASVVIVELEPSAAAGDLQIVRALSQQGCLVIAMSVRSGLRSSSLAAGAVSFVEKDERGAAGLVEAMRAAAAEVNLSQDPDDST
jgi:DNA-binding NarL/FixJ family response regulator